MGGAMGAFLGLNSAERLGAHSAVWVLRAVVRSQSVYGVDIDCCW